MLLRHEGKRNSAYIDAVGKITVGIGHNITDKPISDAAVAQIFADDIADATNDAKAFDWYDGLTPVRKIGSLVDLQQNAINHLGESIKSLGERLHPILSNAEAEPDGPYPDVCLNSELASIVHRNTTQIESLHRALVSIIMRCEL